MKDWENELKQSLKQRWKRYRLALRRCQHHCSEKSVHASRVEARRLLALVELLGVFLGQSQLKKTRRLLKCHLNTFAALRDTQVQLLLLAQHRHEFPELEPFHRMLHQRRDRCLRTAARRIGRLKTRAVQKVMRRLRQQLGHLREDAAARTRHRSAVLHAVSEAFARTLRLQRAMDPGAVETIHRTRVAFKKFRYMVEALEPLFDGITTERIAPMQRFQSMLGEVQDTEVFFARLDKYVRGHAGRARTLARFRRWLLVRHTARITRCMKHADRLHAFWPLRENPGVTPLSARRTRPAGRGRTTAIRSGSGA